MADYRKLVGDHLRDLDIGYLALNAGCGSGGKLFVETDDKDVENIMHLNGFHVIFLARALLDQMMQRPARSAIVITSSIHSYLSTPLSSTYAGTKALERIFGEALHYEARHKIDVLVYTPGFVDTKLLDRVKAKGGVFLMVTPQESVAAMHRDLGKGALSCGAAKHSFKWFVLTHLVPQAFVYRRMGKKAQA